MVKIRVMPEGPNPTFVDQFPNSLAGGFKISNIQQGTITRVHTDGSGRKLYSADVAVIEQGPKFFVPFVSPYASPDGAAGFHYIPEVGDQCMVANTTSNTPFIVGFHYAMATQDDQTTREPNQKRGGLLGNQPPLSAGSMSMTTRGGNEVRVMRGGNVLIKGRENQKTLYDANLEVIRTVSRNFQVTGSGGDVNWRDNNELDTRTADFVANFFSRASTSNNNTQPFRGGGQVRIQAGEKAQFFRIDVAQEGCEGKLIIGPAGDFMTFTVNDTATIKLGKDSTIGLVAGDATNNAQLTLSPTGLTINVTAGGTPIGLVIGQDQTVTLTSPVRVVLDAPQVVTQSGVVKLNNGVIPMGIGNGISKTLVTGVMPGSGAAQGIVLTGSATVKGTP